MRKIFLLLSFVATLAAMAQKIRVDFAKNEASPERREILEAFTSNFQSQFGLMPVLHLEHLYMKQDFAYLTGKVQDNAGKEIDFAKFRQGSQQNTYAFKGQETHVLLKKIDQSWKVLALLISPDDFSWACWWVDYNAPKEIFDYTDYCR